MIRNIFFAIAIYATMSECSELEINWTQTNEGPCSAPTSKIVLCKIHKQLFLLISVPKKVYCSYISEDTCNFNQTIKSEDFFLASLEDTSIVQFLGERNKRLKFLPRGIGRKFPNLQRLVVNHCRLTIVRDFYFENMEELKVLHLDWNQISTIEPKSFDDLISLRNLSLHHNQITKIEPKAFDDLVSLQFLWLEDNLIETLDEDLFTKMVNLESIFLQINKIKFLSPSTFKIPGGKLGFIDLRSNVCIKWNYGTHTPVSDLETDLERRCSH